MKTYVRLLALLFSFFTGVTFLLHDRPYISSAAGGFSSLNFKQRLDAWQEKFNHTIETVEWPMPEIEDDETSLSPERIPPGLRGAFAEAQEDWHKRIDPEHAAFLPLGDAFDVGKDFDADDLDENGLPDKVVVMGRLHTEDTTWVARELPNWQHAIYTVDAENMTTPLPPNTLTTPLNKGREVMPYLTYIIDHYDNLPSVLAFIHPHRDGYPTAWHTDAPMHSNVYSLQHLQLSYIKKAGYANLRCNFNPGCPAEVRPFAPKSTKEPEAHMAMAWGELFPAEKDNVPKTIAAACCAQFAVSKEQVRVRPKSDYIRFRDWVTKTNLTDYVSGRVFEYTWHIIFGRAAVDCPSLRECYCNVYGRRCQGVMGSLGGGGGGGGGEGPHNNGALGPPLVPAPPPDIIMPPLEPPPSPLPPPDEGYSVGNVAEGSVPKWMLAAALEAAKSMGEYDYATQEDLAMEQALAREEDVNERVKAKLKESARERQGTARRRGRSRDKGVT